MVLGIRRPRTVLGCLVACRNPVRSAGLGAGWLPGASWGGGFPGGGSCRWVFPGPRLGWPRRVLRGGAVPCRAAPGPVAEPASPEHQRSRMVPGRLGVVPAERGEPVLRAPSRGIGRISDDHVQAGVGAHLHQPVPEPRGRDAGDCPAEPASAPSAGGPAPGPLAAFGACPGKVEVLDHNCPRALFPRGGDDGADRVAEPPVPRGGGQPGQVQRHRERRACHVPVSCHDGDGEVAGVDVDRHHRMRPQFARRRGRPGISGLP